MANPELPKEGAELPKEGEKILRALRLLTRGDETVPPDESDIRELDVGEGPTTADENHDVERSSVRRSSRL